MTMNGMPTSAASATNGLTTNANPRVSSVVTDPTRISGTPVRVTSWMASMSEVDRDSTSPGSTVSTRRTGRASSAAKNSVRRIAKTRSPSANDQAAAV